MSKTFRNAVLLTACILLLAGLIVYVVLSQRIYMNPQGTVGNTAGNLNNEGLFCEYDGRVYFANAADGGSLYSMNIDETDVKKLNELKVRNLLAGGKYLYFFQTGTTAKSTIGNLQGLRTFDRCKLDGSDETALTRDTVITGQLVDNYLYLLTTSSSAVAFYKLKIDKSDMVPLADYAINPACASDGIIYYNGTQDDHYLYALNTAGDTVSALWHGDLWYPVLDNGYIYYLDVANNYRLCRYSLSLDVIEVLTEDRVDCFNVGSGYIYYQKNGSSPQLRCMFTDGSGNKAVAEGNYTHINMTSRYVYFQLFGDESLTYHSLLGSDSYGTFIP